ncbi:MAG: LemA family protein [Pseudomonadota bacterium]|nr:LemA family protein [Pseudomonadota bacterium]
MPNRIVRLAGMLSLLVLLAGCGVNEIPKLEEAAKAAWAQVQNQYQRRADLVPNLVETVKGFAAQEREVLTAVTEARAKVSQMVLPQNLTSDPEAFRQFQQAQGQLGSALSRLLVTVERYPELRSAENFLTLQAQLEGTENRIAVARQDYIQAVQALNTELRTFPGVIWASTLHSGVQPMESFTATEGAATPPKVNFGTQ